MRLCARPGCETSLEKKRADAVWCSDACYIAAKRQREALQSANTTPKQLDVMLGVLREAGETGVHTFQLRQAYIANPSQRRAELEQLGHAITSVRERLHGRGVGARYRLVRDAEAA